MLLKRNFGEIRKKSCGLAVNFFGVFLNPRFKVTLPEPYQVPHFNIGEGAPKNCTPYPTGLNIENLGGLLDSQQVLVFHFANPLGPEFGPVC